MNEWISVKDRLPETCKEVLVTYKGFFEVAILDQQDVWREWATAAELFNVTHWMPLPELPEDEKI